MGIAADAAKDLAMTFASTIYDVTPAKAGVYKTIFWIPVFTGMTAFK